jgi:regulatory protein YycH of two-component signal transduction system YycFG
MAFEKGRTKTGGREAGTGNKVNMFNQETIEKSMEVIAAQVALGDIEASKLVLGYSLSKPATHQVGIVAELEKMKSESEIKKITRNEEEAELLGF